MKDNLKDNFNNDINDLKDYEYTIVLDGSYMAPGSEVEVIAEEVPAKKKEDPKAEADRIYAEYEAMCMKEPTVLDTDDIYPHSYYWRIGDRYDPAKVAVVEAAIKDGKRIADTEAFAEYAEKVKNSKYTPESWD